MSQQEVTATVTELQELKRMQEEIAARIESLTDSIKDHMGESVELVAGAFKVTWKPVTSSRVDVTAIKKELPELAARYTKTTTVRRFIVA